MKTPSRLALLVASVIAVTVVAAGAATTTAAEYRDSSHARTERTSASVPMTMYAGRQAKLVDTAMSIGADNKAYVWGRVGAGGDAGAALAGIATSESWNAAKGYPRKVEIPGDPDLVDVAADRRTALAIDADGGVWAWGAGSYLHPDSTSQYTSKGYAAKQVQRADGEPLSNITMVAAAERNAAIAVDEDGTIWRWGNPEQGGVEGFRPQQSPLPASEHGRPVSVTGGYYIVSTVLDDGDVYVWGTTKPYGHTFELPGNPAVRPTDGATLVEGLQPWSRANSPDAYVVQVAFGGFDYGYGAALLSDNSLLTWGSTGMVAGHTDPTTPQIVADDVAVLAPNFYGVAYLRAPQDPTSAGYDLWGYGPMNYALGNGSAAPQLVDTDVSSISPGMGQNFWMKVNGRGEVTGILGRGYNPQGAMGLNAAGTAPYPYETVIREIRFPDKPISDLSFLAR